MPTVIDSLILEIGLDPTKFTSGQKLAIKSFSDAKDAAVKTGNEIEAAGKRSAEFMGLLQTKINAVGGALVAAAGTYGVGKFIAETTKQDAATGRLAYTLGTNVKELDKWRNAAYLVGGSADSITQGIQGLTNQFQDFAITGESSVIPWFRALNVNIADTNTGKMRDFGSIMHDLSNAFQKLDPVKAAAFGRNMGIPPDLVNLLIKGGTELDKILATSEKLSTLNAQSAENATKLASAYAQWEIAITGVGRALLNYLTPGLISVAESQTGTFAELKRGEFISKGSLLDSIIHGTPFRGFGPRTGGTGSGAFSSDQEKEAFIRAEAAKRGISPDVAMKVARSEGFDKYIGDQGTSFGAFQLHYKNNIPGLSLGGLGDTFTKKTGLNASDPSTERQQIEFALDQAKSGGWAPWHGWKGAQFAGIDKSGGGGSSSSEIKIDNINIQTQATDATGIANTIAPAIKRASDSYQSIGGGR